MMSLGTTQICGQRLSALEVQDICKSLESNTIKCLALRECKANDKLYEKLMHSLSKCKSIIQLNLNLGIVSSFERLKLLSQAVYRNRSLSTLFIHGSQLDTTGAELLCRALAVHPNIVSLDVGDCGLSDSSLTSLAELLPPNGAKRGLQDLTLSGNSSISSQGWIKFFIALACSNTLKRLYVDYTNLGDECVNCLAVALASNRTLEVLDLEGTGITDNGAQVLLHLVRNYPIPLKEIGLEGNKIKKKTKDTINLSLRENLEKTKQSAQSINITDGLESDASSSVDMTSTMGSTTTLNSEKSQETSDMENTVSELNSLQLDDNAESEEESESDDDTVISAPVIPKRPHMSSSFGRNSSQMNQDIAGKDSSEEEEEMGTLLTGHTLPGYYANPVGVGAYNTRNKNYQQASDMSWGSGGYGSLHTQDAVRMAYVDAME